ncbi:MAG: BatD family protein [Candidatus Thiodiazotropha sp. (ex Ustalcina ferruginea)]|nr:BatD family protein [Candidatus Thiodiazotropha sp. (ex Ustalcina ferruginea)]
MQMTKRSLTQPSKVLLILILLLLSAPINAKVTAILSSESTSLDQPVRLTLQQEGEQEMSPDLTGLEKEFDILGRSSQQSISVINGQMSAKRSLSLTLLPKRAGKLDIPPIKMGAESTHPLTLQVSEQPQDEPLSKTQGVLVELSLNKPKAYIEEEVLLTLKLFQAPGIRGESLDEPSPSMPDTQMKLLQEEHYNSEREGIKYRVLERRYAVFSYQSGNLEIGGARFRGRTGKDALFSLFNDPFTTPRKAPRIVRSESNKVNVEILPIPQSFKGKYWLPARNFQIVENSIEDQTPFFAGKPLTRRIMVFADGLMSSQLPNIEQALPNAIKQYQERPQFNDTPTRTGISGSRKSSLTLIGTEPGHYDLPAIEIPWWNTESDRQEVAQLPAQLLEILPNPTASSPSLQQHPPPQAALEHSPLVSEDEVRSTQEPSLPEETLSRDYWLTWLLGIAWLATLFAWWYTRHKNQSHQDVPIDTPTKQDNPDQRALDEAQERIQQAYANNEAIAARSAWLDWAQLKWPKNPPNNLTRLAKRCGEEVSQAVTRLERALYSPSAEPDWTGYDVLRLIEQMQQEKQQEPQQERLIPLNP